MMPVASSSGVTTSYDTTALLRLIRHGISSLRRDGPFAKRQSTESDTSEGHRGGEATGTSKRLSEKASSPRGDTDEPATKQARHEVAASTSRPTPRDPSPFDAHILQPISGQKYWVGMKYVDLPLSSLGLTPLLATRPPGEKNKWFLGKPCCYLKLGTSLVFTGIVAGSDGNLFQFIPDKDQPAEVDWVPQTSCYCLPEDLPSFRAKVRQTVLDILKEPRTPPSLT